MPNNKLGVIFVSSFKLTFYQNIIRRLSNDRNWIDRDAEFKPQLNRYHLYISYACPWAHRTLIMRALKKLEAVITIDIVSPLMLDEGWSFEKDFDQIVEDSTNNAGFLKELYLKADSNFTGCVTVPVLWDKKRRTIVNNESSDIIRIFNSAFNDFTPIHHDYYPVALWPEIDNLNARIYQKLNNGVYRCGFARSQEAYETAFGEVYSILDELEDRLEYKRYLLGETLTEADIRLFPTLIRFDPVYHSHFKCNGKLIREYKNLSRYIKDLVNIPEIKETIRLDHIKAHYYFSHTELNPSRIIARGFLASS